MPLDYTTSMMVEDIIETVQDNAPVMIMAGITIASVNLVIGWFMYLLFEKLAKAYKG